MEIPDPAGGQRRDLEIKPFRSMMLLNSPAFIPPQIAIDLWWQESGVDHEITRRMRNESYKRSRNENYLLRYGNDRLARAHGRRYHSSAILSRILWD